MNPARPSSLDPVADHRLDLDVLGDELAELVAKISDELVEIRRDLHAHPELGRQETRTTTVIHERLAAAGLTPVVLPGGSGVICDIGHGTRTVALRADIDALPIDDEKDDGLLPVDGPGRLSRLRPRRPHRSAARASASSWPSWRTVASSTAGCG